MAGKIRREVISLEGEDDSSVLEMDGLGISAVAAIALADSDKNSRLLSILLIIFMLYYGRYVFYARLCCFSLPFELLI